MALMAMAGRSVAVLEVLAGQLRQVSEQQNVLAEMVETGRRQAAVVVAVRLPEVQRQETLDRMRLHQPAATAEQQLRMVVPAEKAETHLRQALLEVILAAVAVVMAREAEPGTAQMAAMGGYV